MKHDGQRRVARLTAAACWLLAACAQAAQPATPIQTRPQLDAYLAQNAAANPFDALSAGARERFLASLMFGEVGIISMDPNELADELDDPQIHAVLALFGERVLEYAPKSRAAEVRAVERRVTKR